jgi:transforming growth factor-beta-induced protein
MQTRLARLLAGLLALSLITAACGDDDATEPASTEAPPAEAPDADGPGTIVDVAVQADDFTTLVAAVQAAELVDTLSDEGPFTVLAPTDEAFDTALDNLGLTAEELLADTDLLSSVLTYHVIAGEVPSSKVVTLDGQSVATINGAEARITVDGETVMIDDATVVATDVEASNGVIHVIDTVLLPPS